MLQRYLRERFAPTPLLVLRVTNGSAGYLPPRELYGRGLYQERQSPFAAGCLETTIVDSVPFGSTGYCARQAA
jgi:hypothetical protein